MAALDAKNPSRRRKTAVLVAACLLLGAPASAQRPALAHKIVEALGGAERLKAVATVETVASAIHFSAMYNEAAGGPPIHLSNATVETAYQPSTGRFRVATRLDAFHPFADSFDYREAFDGRFASRAGPSDYRGGGPQMHGAYLGALLKRLRLAHPQWLLGEAEQVVPAGVRSVGGLMLPSLSVTAHGAHWILSVDPETFLPRAVTVREPHAFHGTIAVRVLYRDWGAVDGIRVPFRIERFDNGVLVRRVVRHRVVLGPAGAPERFRLASPEALSPAVPDARDWGWSMSHWFLDRAAMGRSSETDRRPPVRFREVGAGLYQVAGSSHHSLVVVGTDALAVVDAPFYPERSQQILDALGARWPDRPVRHLVLTHHHLDHAGGLLPYIEAGADLVVPAGSAGFFAEVLARAAATDASALRTVERRASLPGLGRAVEALHVPNAHSDAMLVVFVPDAGLLFVTDLFSPGRPAEAQNPQSSKALLHAIDYYGLEVRSIVGGHGAPGAPLAALERAAR